MKILSELKERSIVQVSLVYVGLAWVLVQVADTMLETFEAPEWVMKVLILLLVVGFPVAIVLAWAQGLRKRDSVPAEAPESFASGEDTTGTSLQEESSNTGAADPKSIAVLAFEDMSPDRDHEYFSDGMSEEILNLLARIPDLVVIGRTSSFSFKGKDVGISEIGAALNVAHVLEGSVRKSGNKVRITVQLIKVEGDFHVWSEHFDRELEDVFQIQDEIALAVTRKLESTLRNDGSLVRQTPENMEAYELTLKGLHQTNRGVDGVQSSLDFFDRALAIEPGYSRAHEGLSRYYVMSGIFGFLPALDAIPKIQTHCNAALETDPGSAISYARLACSAMVLEWDWSETRRNLKEAITLGPNDAYVQFVLSQWYQTCGDEAQAIASIEQSVALDPLNLFQLWMSGYIYMTFDLMDQGESRLKQVLELDPGYSEATRLIAHVALERGELDRALELAEQVYAVQKGVTMASNWTLAKVHIARGNEGEARRVLQGLIDRSQHEFVQASVPANIYAWLGEMDSAFEWLEKAYEEHDPSFRLINVDPGFDIFRSDPRFARYEERLNIPNGAL
jgi:TolB-like protein/lipopolysaccharide biosynthesis regulator YciM